MLKYSREDVEKMTGEINYFRKQLFGGFNRDDVVKYIAKLAKERNELEVAKVKAENDARAIAHEAAALRLETEQALQLMRINIAYKESVFTTVEYTFAEFELEFKELYGTIKATSADVLAGLRNAGDTVEKLSLLFSHAGERFEGLRLALSDGNCEDDKPIADITDEEEVSLACDVWACEI